MQNQTKKRIAIVPGSFDPITLGHIDIVRRAAELYDQVYLAVMINRDKRYTFTLDERRRLAELALSDLERVQVISSEGMLWELARDLDACAIVKGYRNNLDLAYEQTMAEYNAARYPDAKTVLLPSDEKLLTVSSTAARERLSHSEDLKQYLPSEVIKEIENILAKRK